MKLFTLFLADDDLNGTELFLTERTALERWVERVFAGDDHATERADLLAQYDRLGIHGEPDEGPSVYDWLQENTASWDTYVLTEHDRPDLVPVAAPASAAPEEHPDRFLNHYVCPRCATPWTDHSPSMTDDDCPSCGLRHISPTSSEDVA